MGEGRAGRATVEASVNGNCNNINLSI
jgi:hypothetical protein